MFIKDKRFINWAGVIFVILLSIYLGYHIGSRKEILFDTDFGTGTPRLIIRDRTAPVVLPKDIDFNLFWKVWDMMKRDYVNKPVDDKQVFYGALEGMVASLGDPYSVFLKPDISKEFTDELSGEFEGIGAELGIKNGVLTVISPLPNTPAEKSGLRAGDKIYAINDETAVGVYLDDAVKKIRGKKGTGVKLTIIREGIDKPKEIRIIRDAIKFDSVKLEFIDKNIAYIRILHFNTDTVDLFDQAVKDVLKRNPKGIILDLRGNPGGFLDAAVEVSSEWIEDGTVVTEKFSDIKKIEHNATGKAHLKDFKTIVLINRGSASGSEIVAGALKDDKKATLVGEKTFGKGSVQSLENFDDGSSLKLTVAKWLTPNGTSISEVGVAPDIEVKLTEDNYNKDEDPQLDKAIEMIKSSKRE